MDAHYFISSFSFICSSTCPCRYLLYRGYIFTASYVPGSEDIKMNLVSVCVREWLAYYPANFLFYLGTKLNYISQPRHSQGWHVTELTANATEGLAHENLPCQISSMLSLHTLDGFWWAWQPYRGQQNTQNGSILKHYLQEGHLLIRNLFWTLCDWEVNLLNFEPLYISGLVCYGNWHYWHHEPKELITHQNITIQFNKCYKK